MKKRNWVLVLGCAVLVSLAMTSFVWAERGVTDSGGFALDNGGPRQDLPPSGVRYPGVRGVTLT